MRLGTAISVSLIACAAFIAPAAAQSPCPGNPNALGLARTVEVDTTGGPGFGFEHYKAHDFLVLNEVVFTFDDGPWPGNTPAVLAALAHHCTKATFFPVGKHALWHPEILKQVAAAGHTIGGHTWSHANLAGAKAAPAAKRAKGAAEPQSSSMHDRGVEEIEKGFSAVKLALGGPPAPFFRFPFLKDPKDQLDYLGTRNIAVFSTDLDSFDFKMRKPEDVIKSVMTRLERKGKGIILMHDFQQATAKAVPDLLNLLKEKGYKVVHMKAKTPLATIAKWDEAAKSEIKGAIGGDRPTSSVIRTIDEAPPSAPAATAATQTAPAKK
jgi:peptidoglycan/xylan/chitin deacetylase (PgdA/CDA1 family)